LPEGFQTAEFLLEHGLVDHIVHRKQMKETIGGLLRLFANGNGRKNGTNGRH
jgi:acetyl-CoA carboxylase carboxyl transferase subunit beta